jgi:DNA-binding beta-propeller fold protein YncE
VPLSHAVAVPDGSSSLCPPAVCVAAVLGDALRRVSVLGGREGMLRSLGSVLGGSVARFLGGGLRGVVSRIIDTPGVISHSNGVAVSRDGATLLVSDRRGGSHAIHVFSVADGSRLRVIGGMGAGPLQFNGPRQVWIASDDFVFVADCLNHRVQVLTPSLEFHAFVGVDELRLQYPSGVCANADVVIVSQHTNRISVFSRGDGAFLHRFGGVGSGDGQLNTPCGLCFMSDDRFFAVAEYSNCRVSLFSVSGEFVRHVGGNVFGVVEGVACSAYDELVVADKGHDRLVLFSAGGEIFKTIACGNVLGVALHCGTVFLQDWEAQACLLCT